MEAVATLCGYCKEREMVDALNKDGGPTGFMICPNCDSPTGVTPEVEDDDDDWEEPT